jgi:5-methylcytosine-specific restriction endonuclease McrA
MFQETRETQDPVGGGSRYAGCDAAEVVEAVAQLGQLSSAVHAEQLALVRDLAGREWPIGTARNPVELCEQQLGMLRATAKETVRVAVALGELPALAALYASGEVSWDQVRFATRFAEAGTDDFVAEQLGDLTAAQVAQLAKEHATRTARDDAEADRQIRCRTRRDHRLGGTHFSIFLPDGDAEGLRSSLEQRAQAIGADPITGLWAPLERRMGMAAAMLGAADLPLGGDLDRALTVIHIDHDVLAGESDGNAVSESGSVMSAEVARRLCCDGWIQYVAEDDTDRPVGVGRRQRTVPRWLRRLVRHRDRTCRCCGGPIHHIHHIVHWTWEGPTDEDNLVGLCFGCHHRVHEGGWRITGNPNGALTFTNPYGETVTTVRQPTVKDWKRRAARHRARPHGPAPDPAGPDQPPGPAPAATFVADPAPTPWTATNTAPGTGRPAPGARPHGPAATPAVAATGVIPAARAHPGPATPRPPLLPRSPGPEPP